MNIYWLDERDREAAKMYVDHHVTRMPVEIVQLLSAAIRRQGIDDPRLYRGPSDHPIVDWICQSRSHFMRVVKHGWCLNEEYEHRYESHHSSFQRLRYLSRYEDQFPRGDSIDPPVLVDDHYREEDMIESYRQMYSKEMTHIIQYTRRSIPRWVISSESEE